MTLRAKYYFYTKSQPSSLPEVTNFLQTPPFKIIGATNGPLFDEQPTGGSCNCFQRGLEQKPRSP
jgi:hypothetical protein